MLEDENTADDAAGQAAFDAGFEDKPVEKAPEQTETKPATESQAKNPEPEYVQITKSDWDTVKAAAMKTASYENQFSKLFGTTGQIQKVIGTLQSQTPRGGKIEISKEAFADLEKDFPELANSTRAALEKALSGVSGTGNAEADDAAIKRALAEHNAKVAEREIEALEDEHPDWRKVVGAVSVGEDPDPEHPFRKWLGTKPPEYQARVNGTESAAVISRAISLFQRETKAPPKPQPQARDNARAGVLRDAVQPKGDGGVPTSSNTPEDAFAAGFGS